MKLRKIRLTRRKENRNFADTHSTKAFFVWRQEIPKLIFRTFAKRGGHLAGAEALSHAFKGRKVANEIIA